MSAPIQKHLMAGVLVGGVPQHAPLAAGEIVTLENGAEVYQEATAALTKYVATTGSDVTGDGTALFPYATVDRAHRDLPKILPCPANIIVAAGDYPGGWPRCIDNVFTQNGSLTIYGKGAPTQKAVHGGPHAVTGSASLAGGCARRVTVGAAVGWVADEFCGYWVRIVTGAHPGRTFPVYGNTTTSICISDGTDSVQVGDTVEIIAPSVKIALEDTVIAYTSRSAASTPAGAYSKLTLANLWLDGSASPNLWSQFVVQSDLGQYDGPNFDFVRVDVLDWGAYVIKTVTAIYPPMDAVYVADCDAGIANLTETLSGPSFSIVNASGRAAQAVLQNEGTIYAGAIMGSVTWQGASAFFAGGCAAIADWTERGGDAQCWLAGVDAVTPAILNARGSFKIHVEGPCEYAIYGDDQGLIRLHSENYCSPTLCAKSAVSVGPMGRLLTKDACANFLGALAGQKAYIFRGNTAVKSDTWPAANTPVDDTRGGLLLRTA